LNATAILPVKRFGAAKQRLATGVSKERRAAIVAAMLEDVLEAIGATRLVERTRRRAPRSSPTPTREGIPGQRSPA
jgi:hypothetical protein